MTGKIYQGDAFKALREMDCDSIDCVMTSPPYWALRDYGVAGQLGLEPTYQEYITRLCDIFDEVQRVLKPTGTCWVNIGDTYSSQRWSDSPSTTGKSRVCSDIVIEKKTQLPEKSLVGIPFRFAIEMINRGWILRNTIIWKKNNCMPQSAKDRFTVDFEYLFLFSHAKRYYFDQQKEPIKAESIARSRRGVSGSHKNVNGAPGQTPHSIAKPRENTTKQDMHPNRQVRGFNKRWAAKCRDGIPGQAPHSFNHEGRSGYFNADGTFIGNPTGRNKRCVWTINPKPFKEAHFAVFPEELCETPIKAGCPEFVCKKCGKPREKTYQHKSNYGRREPAHVPGNTPDKVDSSEWKPPSITFEGYSTPCSCEAGYEPGTVLDPFFGSGTVGCVAERLRRRWVGIELSPEYVKIAEKRLQKYLYWPKQTEVIE